MREARACETLDPAMHDAALPFTSAFLLGLLHSLEPSHAKAVLASYFLNRRRTVAEAMAFAMTITVAHTLSIYVLAAIGYALGPALVKENLARGFEMAGGALMVGVGVWMLWSERRADFHRNGCCGDAEGHFFHHHVHGHHHATPSSLRQAFVLGFCSGSIPCLTGVAVLLMAWSTATPARGMAQVFVFSLGLGIVVLALSLGMRQMAQAMERYWRGATRWTRFLPVASAGLILGVGLWVLFGALSTAPKEQKKSQEQYLKPT
ncbi:MAG: sulfite exporter TauE/SafE family protein [Verrucomicrobiae bacterium]|nr:sulfite exporter TauE/SafE family protein [Verrucomicrobiae bacterium]